MRKIITVAAATAAMSFALVAPAFAQTSETLHLTSNCSVTATGPSFEVATLPNPGVTPNGSLGESVNCPV